MVEHGSFLSCGTVLFCIAMSGTTGVVDCDAGCMVEKLETNRTSDLSSSIRPSTKTALIVLASIFGLLLALGVAASVSGYPFDMYLALFEIFRGHWHLSLVSWLVFVGLVGFIVLLVVWGLRIARHHSPDVARAGVTRVDRYARVLGHGEAVEKVSATRAEKMAGKLIKNYDPLMSAGYPLGRNLIDGQAMSSSWEDMVVVLAGPRSGKSLCYAIPGCLSAPGPLVATSNKRDILDVTMPVRSHDHPGATQWVFDPEHIAHPGTGKAPWVWNIVDSIHEIADAKRIADCWRYASGQPATGGDDFFPGTAAQQLADYLLAAAVADRTVEDVFIWATNERNTTPATILSKAGYTALAARTNGVLGLTPETRSGVFGSLQSMVAFLADESVREWVVPVPGDERPRFDPFSFATSEDSLYLLSAKGRPSTALTSALTATVAFEGFRRAQAEFGGRLPVPECFVLDEAANICRWPELSDVYSYFGSAGLPIMTIWQNPDQGEEAFGKTSFGSLYNNANVTVYLGGIKSTSFLNDLSALVGRQEVVRANTSISEHGRRNVSRSIQWEDILPASRLAEWPVGRALILASQARAQIVRTQPWIENEKWVSLQEKAA